jgi:hypothetical protein
MGAMEVGPPIVFSNDTDEVIYLGSTMGMSGNNVWGMGTFFLITVASEPRLKVPFYFPLMKMTTLPIKIA